MKARIRPIPSSAASSTRSARGSSRHAARATLAIIAGNCLAIDQNDTLSSGFSYCAHALSCRNAPLNRSCSLSDNVDCWGGLLSQVNTEPPRGRGKEREGKRGREREGGKEREGATRSVLGESDGGGRWCGRGSARSAGP